MNSRRLPSGSRMASTPSRIQRARLARMFDHKKMRDAAFMPMDEKNPLQPRLSWWTRRQHFASFRRIAPVPTEAGRELAYSG